MRSSVAHRPCRRGLRSLRVPMRAMLLVSILLLAGPSSSTVSLMASGMLSQDDQTQAIWQGNSGGFIIRWTTSDIQVAAVDQPEQVIFSLVPMVHKGFEAFLSTVKDPSSGTREEPCTYERQFKLLSVVGPLLSLEDTVYAFCQGWAHPAVGTRFTAVDLARPGVMGYAITDGLPPLALDVANPGKITMLTDYFAEEAILSALLTDPILAKALHTERHSRVPQTFSNLAQALEDQPVEAQDCLFRFPADVLTRFAFHHVNNDNVAIRLGLPPDAGPCRGLHAQVGILLSMPAELRNALSRAAAGKQGFLMQDQRKIGANRRTTVAFATGTFKRP